MEASRAMFHGFTSIDNAHLLAFCTNQTYLTDADLIVDLVFFRYVHHLRTLSARWHLNGNTRNLLPDI